MPLADEIPVTSMTLRDLETFLRKHPVWIAAGREEGGVKVQMIEHGARRGAVGHGVTLQEALHDAAAHFDLWDPKVNDEGGL